MGHQASISVSSCKKMLDQDELERSDEDLYEHFRFKADPGQEIIRVDKFLLDRLSNTSRSKIQTAAKNGTVHVNGAIIKQNYKVKPGDEVAIVLPYPIRQLELIPQDIPLSIVFEDDELIVVNKPANMVVHPGYGHYSGTLVNALVHHFGNLPELNEEYYGRPGLVHREQLRSDDFHDHRVAASRAAAERGVVQNQGHQRQRLRGADRRARRREGCGL